MSEYILQMADAILQEAIDNYPDTAMSHADAERIAMYRINKECQDKIEGRS